ncbi:CAF17-like 4Fe-4S cluster assembly/insertion protein YgfZ [Parvularcula lutaonensis]|uniref:YgfZ/GcvT domain-containing protein n=1 Tax=Parvularcula lutaonensis TaxID=491923 RepID=A0ABV7M808_9PROT|nr:folate-binding protein YgfZ [Parvularcula lutaonensis]GGY43596.1 folate-binding protein [Parvularcula lutaonensis]
MSFKPTALARDLINAEGPDAEQLLNSVLSADVSGKKPGDIVYACLLTPQGKVLDVMYLHRLTNGFLIDVFQGRGAPLAKQLNMYKMRARATFEKVPGGVFVAPDHLAPEDAGSDPRMEGLGKRWYTLGPLVEGPKNPSFFQLMRRLGIPEFGLDYHSGDVFPMDVNLDALGAVDYKKGCFVGQEVASRMFRKGEIRKRTLKVYGDADLPRGTTLRQRGNIVGTVTSMIGGEGLAIMRLDRIQGAECFALHNGFDLQLKIRKPAYLA